MLPSSLFFPQLFNQVINDVCITHQMKAKFFVVKHTANIGIIEYPQCPVC